MGRSQTEYGAEPDRVGGGSRQSMRWSCVSCVSVQCAFTEFFVLLTASRTLISLMLKNVPKHQIKRS